MSVRFHAWYNLTHVIIIKDPKSFMDEKGPSRQLHWERFGRLSAHPGLVLINLLHIGINNISFPGNPLF